MLTKTCECETKNLNHLQRILTFTFIGSELLQKFGNISMLRAEIRERKNRKEGNAK